MQGSVRVIEELMKFDRAGVISARNKITEATPLQLASEGGHANVVKVLVRAGASPTDENRVWSTVYIKNICSIKFNRYLANLLIWF